jgi:uncharacterized protein (TIGR03792 family)
VIVEFLTFRVDPAEQAGWLPVEEQTWSRFLEQQPGFVRKEMWTNREDPWEVHAIIWWETQEQWFSITSEKVAEIDATMGPWFREATSMRIFDVARES